jgi:class 3 adenylate cyclase
LKLLYFAVLLLIAVSSQQPLFCDLTGQARLDSLFKELPNAKGDTNEVELLSDISYTYQVINTDKGVAYGEMAISLAKKLGWKVGLSKSFNSVAVNYALKPDNMKAITYLKKSLVIDKELGDKNGVSKLLINIGNIYLNQSDYAKALEYHLQALKLFEELGNNGGVSIALGNIAVNYFSQMNYTKSLEYNYKALKIFQELGSKRGIAGSLLNIGGNYHKQSNYAKALEYDYKALKMFEELDAKRGISITLEDIGSIYADQSNYSKALEYCQKSIEVGKDMGGQRLIAQGMLSTGKIYFNLSKDSTIQNLSPENKYLALNKVANINIAIDYFQKANSLALETGDLLKQSEAFKFLYQAFKLKGNYEQSLLAYESYTKLKDSVFSLKNSNKIAALEKAREEDVNRIQIEKQKVQIAAQEKEKAYIIYGSVGALLSVLSILGLVFYQRKKSDKLLYNVLPVSIAKRLKKKEHPISDYFNQASIIFIDIVGFTSMTKNADPQLIVESLNNIFTQYDKIADKYGLEKIKTIGDSYMAAAGIPEVQEDNAHRAAKMALEVKEMMKDYHTADGTKIEVRLGLDCGPVVAGVIGKKKFTYDMWSDAVNTASRMESSSQAGEVQVSERFKEAVTQYEQFAYVERGEVQIKGKGAMKTYFMESVS